MLLQQSRGDLASSALSLNTLISNAVTTEKVGMRARRFVYIAESVSEDMRWQRDICSVCIRIPMLSSSCHICGLTLFSEPEKEVRNVKLDFRGAPAPRRYN